MTKVKRIIQFILALLNFLFHFKPVPDEEPPIDSETYPGASREDPKERDEAVFETVR